MLACRRRRCCNAAVVAAFLLVCIYALLNSAGTSADWLPPQQLLALDGSPSAPPSAPPSASPSVDPHGLTPAETASLTRLSAECQPNKTIAAVREYAAWREAKMTFLRAAAGNVSVARRLQAEAGDSDPPMTLAIYGNLGGGWGDRMPAIVSLFLFAVRYRRVFFLHYPAATPWLASPFFNWAVDAELLPVLQAELLAHPPSVFYTCEAARLCIWSTAQPDVRFDAARGISPYLVTNRGAWSTGTLAEHAAWLDAFVDGRPACAYQALFRPTGALLALPAVRAAERRFRAARARGAGGRVVGMHVRTGDDVILSELQARLGANASAAAGERPDADSARARLIELTRERAPMLPYLLAQAANRSNDTLFFTADSLELRRMVAILYPAAVISETRPMHVGDDMPRGYIEALRDSTAEATTASMSVVIMREALVDWWLLARADIRVGKLGSGFVRAASLASETGAYDAGPDCNGDRICCGALATHATTALCFRTIGSAAR